MVASSDELVDGSFWCANERPIILETQPTSWATHVIFIVLVPPTIHDMSWSFVFSFRF